MFVGFQPQALEFDLTSGLGLSVFLFRGTQEEESLFASLQTATHTIGSVTILCESIHRDYYSVQSGNDDLVRKVLCKRLGVSTDDGIKTRLMGLSYHLRRSGVEQGFSLKIKLNGMGIWRRLIEHPFPDLRRHHTIYPLSIFPHPHRALRTTKLTDRGRLDGYEHRRMVYMPWLMYAKH